MTTEGFRKARFAPDWLQTRPGELCCIRVPASATDGIYSVAEIVSAPGDATPLHVHHNEDEHLLVLEGTVRVACGGRITDVHAGTLMTLPRNIAHAWGNRSDAEVRMVFLVTPGGVEEALRLVASVGEIDMPAFAKRFNVDVLGPPPF